MLFRSPDRPRFDHVSTLPKVSLVERDPDDVATIGVPRRSRTSASLRARRSEGGGARRARSAELDQVLHVDTIKPLGYLFKDPSAATFDSVSPSQASRRRTQRIKRSAIDPEPENREEEYQAHRWHVERSTPSPQSSSQAEVRPRQRDRVLR